MNTWVSPFRKFGKVIPCLTGAGWTADGLLYTVMKDPVTLPSSRAVVDRATIKSHLLSDSKDPFNRAPLKIEDVIPSACLPHSFVSDSQTRNSLCRCGTEG